LYDFVFAHRTTITKLCMKYITFFEGLTMVSLRKIHHTYMHIGTSLVIDGIIRWLHCS